MGDEPPIGDEGLPTSTKGTPNSRRLQETCRRGHSLIDKSNVRVYNGHRCCLTCKRLRAAERNAQPEVYQAGLAAWRAYRDRHINDPKWQASRRESDRRKRLKSVYGIDYIEYEALFDAQGGVCAICHSPSKYKFRDGSPNPRLAVDHDHATGRVRALLCNRCNTLLGQFENDMQLARDIFAYIGFELRRRE